VKFVSLENTYTDGPYMNMYDYCCRLLGKLNLIVQELKPILVGLNGPSEDGGLLNSM
jgi:hypothetical protein